MDQFQPKNKEVCDLCRLPLASFSLEAEGRKFCCKGCEAVFHILASENALIQGKQHPLYLQALQWGLISNSANMEKEDPPLSSEDPREKWRLLINGMWCISCADLITLALKRMPGVLFSVVDYMTDLAIIEFDPKRCSKQKIEDRIKALGYSCEELTDTELKKEKKGMTGRFFVAFFSSLNVMMFAYPLYATYFEIDLEALKPMLAWLSLAVTLPALFAGAPLFRKMFQQFSSGLLGMETLVGLGIIGAMGLSLEEMRRETYHIYFDTAAVVITFVLLGRLIESQGKFSTKNALVQLVHSLPKRARKVEGDSPHFVLLKEVKKGDKLLILRGEKIPLDGVIERGEGSCDESVITGEAVPKWKKRNDTLVGGSLLLSGWLEYQVTKSQEASTLQKIMEMVERGLVAKKREKNFFEQLLTHFTPFVLMLAFFMLVPAVGGYYDFMEGMRRALAVLLIACPCAIGIAVPLIEGKLLELGAKKGVLVKNREALFKLASLTTLFTDKTGTLTEGKFQVLKGLEKLSLEQKRLLKTLTTYASHPIPKAIGDALDTQTALEIASFQEWIGAGVKGLYNNKWFALGSYLFAKEQGAQHLAPPEGSDSKVYFLEDSVCIAVIELGDKLRSDAVPFLNAFSGVRRIMVSGDHPATTKNLAETLPLEEWRGGLSPLQKLEMVKKCDRQGGYVAFLGDGVNDAPALSEADVSISMMNGAEISTHIADLVLTTPHLISLAEFRVLAIKGKKLALQNLFWAFAYNIIGLFLAVSGLMNPLYATFSMLISSLFVLLNTKRLENGSKQVRGLLPIQDHFSGLTRHHYFKSFFKLINRKLVGNDRGDVKP